ncbi:extracellular solute-binding protein [Paenarthrobacter aromaticivorans]|uniref:extracellular solute-binding protein n=1 Tax=Paenarthrobacter aromaticivorans TaxID=2849150 RepID=UPI003A80B4FA
MNINKHRRARALAVVSFPLAVALLAGCSTSASGPATTETLTFATFGGAYENAQRKAWIDEFTSSTGIEVLTDSADYGKLKTMVEAGDVSWDVVDVQGDYGLESQSALLEPIDCKVVTTCDTPAPGLKNTTWRVAENTSAMLFGYNTQVTSRTPNGWKDFFDTTTFPGKRGFPSWISGGALEAALLADGVAPESLYPLDVDRALRKLDTIKKDIIWWETGTQSEDLLSSGETVFSMLFSPRVYNLAEVSKKPVAAQWNEVITFGNYLVVPKGTKHKDAAMKLIAWMADKERNAKLGSVYPQGPGTAGATAEVPSAIKAWLPTEHLESSVAVNDGYWDKEFNSVNSKFQAWKLK